MRESRLKVAIFGTRFSETQHIDKTISIVKQILQKHPSSIIISGGAKGVDTVAEILARSNSMPVTVFLPDWDAHGQYAGLLRNKKIAKSADIGYAIWDGKSTGTKHTIGLFKEMNKDCEVIILE